MPSSSVPSPFLVVSNSAPHRLLTMPDPSARAVTRRPGKAEGQALEILGHALEYLVDTRMFLYREASTRADGEAIQILSRCSREVFATCPEVVPFGQRVRAWFAARLHVGLGELHGVHKA